MKNLLHCKENGWALITHEYIKNNFEQLQSEIDERFINDFEMRRFSLDEVRDVEQYFIPDEVFDNKERVSGSRTEMLLDTAYGEFEELETVFRNILSSIKKNNPNDPIEGVFYSLECFGCIKKVCEEEGIPLFAYSFSAIRKPHGYRQTLFLAHPEGELFGSHDSENRYTRFLQEDNSTIPVFSNREILAILGKQRNLPLLQLIDHTPQYEMARCNDLGAMVPRSFAHTRYTDDDLRYETELRYKSSDIVVRTHAAQLGYMQIDKSDIHNDPASYILSCKRLAAVHSQIMLKALLWKRSVISPKYTMGFSFLCNTDYCDTKIADIKGLNFYIFCCLIPGGLMFSDSYWEWRLTQPTECEIYKRHLKYYINILNLPETILTEKSESKRLESILRSRECDEEVIKDVLNNDQGNDIDYYVASSRFVCDGKSHWRLNKLKDGNIISRITLPKSNSGVVEFYPMDDVAGFTKLSSIIINGIQVMGETNYEYMRKVSGHYTIDLKDLNMDYILIECVWNYKKVFDFLNS
ncbi:MAG: hypothetical protein IK038_06520 [Bacteroidaceae bacterium]|nr:hypothetical protein [Bacteroidaceae bacterium]